MSGETGVREVSTSSIKDAFGQSISKRTKTVSIDRTLLGSRREGASTLTAAGSSWFRSYVVSRQDSREIKQSATKREANARSSFQSAPIHRISPARENAMNLAL